MPGRTVAVDFGCGTGVLACAAAGAEARARPAEGQPRDHEKIPRGEPERLSLAPASVAASGHSCAEPPAAALAGSPDLIGLTAGAHPYLSKTAG